jgi:hypothetical protein
METKLLIPAYKLTFSRESSTSGAVATVAAPAASGGKVVDTTDEPRASTVVELKVALDMDTPADGLTLVMGQVGSFRPARGDQVKVELGYKDDGGLVHVITAGLVDAKPGLTTLRLVGLSAAEKLLRSSSGEHFVSKSAGAIVKELASRAKVDVERAEEGIAFSAYIVDSRRSLYHNMRDIADLCGFDLYITPEGKLVFEKFVGGRTVHVLEYGKHILALDMLQNAAQAAKVEAWGEGPGSGKGENSWAWLTKNFKPSLGTAGDGEPLFLLERTSLRTGLSASKAAQALHLYFKRQATHGRLFLTGSPQIKLGDAIRLKNVPDESLNASYQVRGIAHRITKSAGFTTVVNFRSLES